MISSPQAARSKRPRPGEKHHEFFARSLAADYPAPKQGDWIAKDFKFHTGESMPELRLHYTTIGEPTGQPVLVLHGSGGSAANMLTAAFGGELFGPGQPLDAAKYYIIIPDGLGHGKSSKPSDGMKTAFPKYNYEDMVDAHYRLVKEGLGVKHLRLVIGNSMGGMHTWIWGGRYPQFMDALVPMASQPTEMAARNWMLRRMMIETIRNDPDYNGGNYTSPPRMMKYAVSAYGIATGGGTLAYQMLAWPMPTTSATSGKPRTTTIRLLDSTRSKPRCSPSTPLTTSAIRRKPASPMRR